MCNPNELANGECLGTGTVKVISNSVSTEAHLSYEKMMVFIAIAMGGEVERVKRTDIHHHHHHRVDNAEHDHDHIHA